VEFGRGYLRKVFAYPCISGIRGYDSQVLGTGGALQGRETVLFFQTYSLGVGPAPASPPPALLAGGRALSQGGATPCFFCREEARPRASKLNLP
jgi:hypothetical protein